jgi:hypothetical protein
MFFQIAMQYTKLRGCEFVDCFCVPALTVTENKGFERNWSALIKRVMKAWHWGKLEPDFENSYF